jgi:hypothetical protein
MAVHRSGRVDLFDAENKTASMAIRPEHIDDEPRWRDPETGELKTYSEAGFKFSEDDLQVLSSAPAEQPPPPEGEQQQQQQQQQPEQPTPTEPTTE